MPPVSERVVAPISDAELERRWSAVRKEMADRKIDVLVRARPEDRDSVEAIRNLVVNPGSGAPVTLSSVADIVETTGPSDRKSTRLNSSH